MTTDNKEDAILNSTDIGIIREVISKNSGNWEDERLLPIKRKIKDYHRSIINNRCCYCRRSFKGEFNFVIDIEHILPKGKFKKFEFTPLNLSISCKRCNMEIKKQDTSFIKSIITIEADPFNSNQYFLIHPNVDEYKEHLKYISLTDDDDRLVKYVPQEGKPKGKFTYEYFKLKDLEEDTANKRQGLINTKPSPLMKQEDIDELQNLLEKLKEK